MSSTVQQQLTSDYCELTKFIDIPSGPVVRLIASTTKDNLAESLDLMTAIFVRTIAGTTMPTYVANGLRDLPLGPMRVVVERALSTHQLLIQRGWLPKKDLVERYANELRIAEILTVLKLKIPNVRALSLHAILRSAYKAVLSRQYERGVRLLALISDRQRSIADPMLFTIGNHLIAEKQFELAENVGRYMSSNYPQRQQLLFNLVIGFAKDGKFDDAKEVAVEYLDDEFFYQSKVEIAKILVENCRDYMDFAERVPLPWRNRVYADGICFALVQIQEFNRANQVAEFIDDPSLRVHTMEQIRIAQKQRQAANGFEPPAKKSRR